MSRRKIAAGNWKMNLNLKEGIELASKIAAGAKPGGNNLVILFPPSTHLAEVAKSAAKSPAVKVGAQNLHQEVSGAFTGEISAEMILSAGADYVLIGHSERREYFGEDAALLKAKTERALNAGLNPVFCCGEPLNIRESGQHKQYVEKQLKDSLFHLSKAEFEKLVIAYEPIWAIGTGVTASPEQAQDMHKQIRGMISDQYGSETANRISILYGGSVKPDNAETLFSQDDVDGGLVGGASLSADGFLKIISAL